MTNCSLKNKEFVENFDLNKLIILPLYMFYREKREKAADLIYINKTQPTTLFENIFRERQALSFVL